MKTGTANLPLHYGKAPGWLFLRMTRLSPPETEAALRRLSRVEGWLSASAGPSSG